jgi:hypothetical protein
MPYDLMEQITHLTLRCHGCDSGQFAPDQDWILDIEGHLPLVDTQPMVTVLLFVMFARHWWMSPNSWVASGVLNSIPEDVHQSMQSDKARS